MAPDPTVGGPQRPEDASRSGFPQERVLRLYLRTLILVLATLLGLAGGVANVATSTLSAIAAIVTVGVMTIFLLLGGPRWVERLLSWLPEDRQPRYRELGNDLYRSVGGYVRGNVAISLVAGAAAA